MSTSTVNVNNVVDNAQIHKVAFKHHVVVSNF